MVGEDLVAVALESHVVIEELSHQDVHRDLVLAPLGSDLCVLELEVLFGVGQRRGHSDKVVVVVTHDQRQHDVRGTQARRDVVLPDDEHRSAASKREQDLHGSPSCETWPCRRQSSP